MMDFGSMGFKRIEGDFNDVRNPINIQQCMIIDLVIVDMTGQVPCAYQLNKENTLTERDFLLIRQGAMQVPHDAFQPVGDIQSINKESKQIILKDRNTIAYQHLIQVTGRPPVLLSYEFLAGLYTLIDALRVNRSRPDRLTPSPITLQPIKISEAPPLDAQLKIENIGFKQLPKKSPAQPTLLVSEFNHKLFQVQI